MTASKAGPLPLSTPRGSEPAGSHLPAVGGATAGAEGAGNPYLGAAESWGTLLPVVAKSCGAQAAT